MKPMFDVVGFAVRDIAKSLHFYRLIGIEVPDDPPEGQQWVQCTMPSGLRVSWNAVELVEAIYPGWTMPDMQRIMFACNCMTSEGVNAAYKRVTGGGYEGLTAPYDADFGQRYAVVMDPDGYRVGLYAWLPGHSA